MPICLVIDSNEFDRRMLVNVINKLDYEVLEANNGGQACTLYGKHHPQLIFVNWSMPEAEGSEFIKSIRALSGGDKPYIITYSADGEMSAQNIASDAYNAGSDDYIQRPITQEKLKDMLTAGGCVRA